MAIDRSKFQGAKLSANKDVQKNAAQNNKGFGNENSRAGFLTIDEGKNVFRIMPPHPDDTIGASYLPKRTAQLACEVNIWKEGVETEETEIKNKHIFSATQHGGLPKDPVELYIEYVRKRANDEFQDKDARASFLSPITGWKDKKGTWNWGIAPKTSFVAFATKDNKFGRLELYESMIKDMDKAAISEEPEDVMSTDPFSDPDAGCELIITKQHKLDKQSKPTSSWEYPITKGGPSAAKRESWDAYFTRTAVTDAQLEELSKQEPLSKMIGNDVYTKRDWDFAMDGLRRLDEKEKYGIFDNDDFLDELLELEKLVPEKKDKDDDVKEMFDKKKPVETKTNAPAPKEKAPEKGEEVEESDEVSESEMRSTLRRFIKKTYGEQFIDQIPVKKSEVEKWYSLWADDEDLPVVTEKKSEPKSEPEKEAVDNTGAVKEEALSSEISKLRALRRSKA